MLQHVPQLKSVALRGLPKASSSWMLAFKGFLQRRCSCTAHQIRSTHISYPESLPASYSSTVHNIVWLQNPMASTMRLCMALPLWLCPGRLLQLPWVREWWGEWSPVRAGDDRERHSGAGGGGRGGGVAAELCGQRRRDAHCDALGEPRGRGAGQPVLRGGVRLPGMLFPLPQIFRV